MKSRSSFSSYAAGLVGGLVAVVVMAAMLLLHAVSRMQIVT
jgi:hypothetical protein